MRNNFTGVRDLFNSGGLFFGEEMRDVVRFMRGFVRGQIKIGEKHSGIACWLRSLALLVSRLNVPNVGYN